MKPETRHQSEILKEVKIKGACRILDLAERLGVSDETIRRHVRPLVDRGIVHKVHGGIIMADRLREAPMGHRMDENREAKMAIAGAAAGLVEDGDSIILDTGSTTSYVARALVRRSNLKVITNSIEIARTLSGQPSNSIYMVGGDMDTGLLATFGPSALDFLKQFHVHHGILSIGGINDAHQLLNFELHEAEFSRAVIEQSAFVTVVADYTKFSRIGLVTAAEVSDIDCFVTDLPPAKSFCDVLHEHDINLITTGPRPSDNP